MTQRGTCNSFFFFFHILRMCVLSIREQVLLGVSYVCYILVLKKKKSMKNLTQESCHTAPWGSSGGAKEHNKHHCYHIRTRRLALIRSLFFSPPFFSLYFLSLCYSSSLFLSPWLLGFLCLPQFFLEADSRKTVCEQDQERVREKGRHRLKQKTRVSSRCQICHQGRGLVSAFRCPYDLNSFISTPVVLLIF